MSWWGGDGAARVLAQDGAALLLERATGERSLVEMARGGRDDEASRVVCAVPARLHAPRGCPPPALIPLPRWFEALEPAAARHGGILSLAARTRASFWRRRQEVVVLHGDLHHGNVLDFRRHGWLAIDPKRLVGERYFDFANLFCNPELGGCKGARASGAGRRASSPKRRASSGRGCCGEFWRGPAYRPPGTWKTARRPKPRSRWHGSWRRRSRAEEAGARDQRGRASSGRPATVASISMILASRRTRKVSVRPIVSRPRSL